MHVDPSSYFDDLISIVERLKSYKNDNELKSKPERFAILVEKAILTGCLYSRKLHEHSAIEKTVMASDLNDHDFFWYINRLIHSRYLYTMPQCIELGIEFRSNRDGDNETHVVSYEDIIGIFSAVLAERANDPR